MMIIKMFNKNTYINLINNLNTYLTKDNFATLIKTIIISLYVLFNISLFLIFIFSFILLYINQLSFGYIFKFKLIAFICSIFWAWVDLFLLSPIVFIPNLIIFIFFYTLIFIKNKLFFKI